jgi:hypothetical protein
MFSALREAKVPEKAFWLRYGPKPYRLETSAEGEEYISGDFAGMPETLVIDEADAMAEPSARVPNRTPAISARVGR